MIFFPKGNTGEIIYSVYNSDKFQTTEAIKNKEETSSRSADQISMRGKDEEKQEMKLFTVTDTYNTDVNQAILTDEESKMKQYR